MIRRTFTFAAIFVMGGAGLGCSDGPKIIPPKQENSKLPSEASAGGGGKTKQPETNPNPPKGGSAKQD